MFCYIICLFVVIVSTTESSPMVGQAGHLARWNLFKKNFGKSYDTAQEELKRFSIFIDNVRFIDQHNEEFKAGKHTFDVGVNKFSDLTNQEFRARVNGFKIPADYKFEGAFFESPANFKDLPDSVDWRDKGLVAEVKDQGNCGSCWAFSAVGGLEGQHANATGHLVSLSEQNLVDCSKKINMGCSGGMMVVAFEYIKNNGGIDTEESYPYTAKNGKCKYNETAKGADDDGFKMIKIGDEQGLTAAIATVGPITVAIDASWPSFQHYKSGVYNEPKCKNKPTQLDHGVLAVGYGATNDGTKYYIVKNSWGNDWGQAGYIWMSRDKSNQCGIASSASYPLV